MVTYYKGKIAKEDVEFGTATFLRYDSALATVEVNQINKSHIPRKVVSLSVDYTIQPYNYPGEVTFTNGSAIADMTITLPVAKSGLGIFCFTNIFTGLNFIIDPNGNNYFRNCSAGKYKSASSAGDRLKVWCDYDGVWEYDYEGIWTNEA